MSNFSNFLKKAWCALVLAASASAAMAGPMYRVNLDTAFLGNTTGLLDLRFDSMDPAVFTQATLSDFSGSFGAEVEKVGAVTGTVPGNVVFTNVPGQNTLLQEVAIGGLLSFTISFSGDFDTVEGENGSLFSISLLNEANNAFLFGNGPFVEFFVIPVFLDDNSSVVVTDNNQLVNVTAIPEPGDLLLMMTGLAMVGFLRRRAAKQA